MGKKDRFSIAIVGLGFVGTSIGLALQREKGDYVVVGHDPDRDAVARAKKSKAVDKTSWNLVSACESSNMVILAVPFHEVRATMEAIAPALEPGALLVDLSTVKKPVRRWAEELLIPKGIGYVGADPIAPVSSKPEPSADAFRHGTLAICTAPETGDVPLQILTGLADRMGMKVLFMGEEEHDSLRAVTTHLPMLLGVSFLNATAGHEAWREIRRLAGREFDALTGVASDPEETISLLAANRENVEKWLGMYLQVLEKWRSALEGGQAEALSSTLTDLLALRDEWMGASISGRWEERQTREIPREGILSRLLGIHGKESR